MLKSKGPRIDPFGTPNRISSRELHAEFILVLCFLFSVLAQEYCIHNQRKKPINV